MLAELLRGRFPSLISNVLLSYWSIGLHPGAAPFFKFLAILFLAVYAAESQVNSLSYAMHGAWLIVFRDSLRSSPPFSLSSSQRSLWPRS